MFGFKEEEVAIIKQSLMPAGHSDADLQLFLATASRSQLDPLSRHIYASGFKEKDRQGNYTGKIKMSIGITIDGFRVIAERSDKYAGQLGPYWCGPDGEWKDVWLSNGAPFAAKVAVLRKDFQEPLWAVAKFSSYTQGQNLWNKLPEQMIAKCAEMLALRKAFPNDLGGLYGKEELGHEEEQVVQSAEGVQQAVTDAEEKAAPPEAAKESNKESSRAKPVAVAPKPKPAQGSAPVPSKDAGGAEQKSPENKEEARGGVATDTTSAGGSDAGVAKGADNTAASEPQQPAVEPPITGEDLMGVLNHGINNGFTEEEISDFIVATFNVTEETILTLTRTQLAQAKHHFTRKKA
jgi:phage recombination protein Bet